MLFKSLQNEGIIFQNPDTSINIFTLTNNINLTGIPTAPTAETGTDSNQIATTEFVQDALSIQNITEYQDTSFVAVGDTYDQAISKLIKIIEDDEYIVADGFNKLNITKSQKIVITDNSSIVSAFIEANKYYVYNASVNTIQIELAPVVADISTLVNPYMCRFICASSGTNIILPANIKMGNNFEFDPAENRIYEITIIDNLANINSCD